MADNKDDKDDRGDIRVEILRAIAALMTAAFAFVAGLAWNQAIQDAIKQLVGPDNGLLGEFIYAIIITIVAVIAVVAIGRAMGRLGVKYKRSGEL